MSAFNEDSVGVAKDPIDVKKGLPFFTMKNYVLPLATTPTEYLNQCKALGIQPDFAWMDKKFLTCKKYKSSEQWTYNDKLCRWNGPAVTRFYPDGSIEGKSWYENGELAQSSEPSEIDYYEDGTILRKKYREEDNLYIIVYDKKGKPKDSVTVSNYFKKLENYDEYF